MDPNREHRSFLNPRDPSIDHKFRPCPQKRRLFAEIKDDNDYDETDSDSVEELECDYTESVENTLMVEEGALVYLRMKPVDLDSPAYSISVDGKTLITVPPSEYTSSSSNKNCMEKHHSFTEIFDSEVSQREVFEKCMRQKILAEESFAVLTYGTSGSGKTYTLLGDDESPGIIPRSLEQIFTLYQANIHPNPLSKLVNARTTFLDDNLVQKEILLRRKILDNCKNLEKNYLQLQNSIRSDHAFITVPSDDVSVFIWVSFAEIYNELVYDLLAFTKSNTNLKIVCNDGNVFIKGITSIYVKSSLEALKLLRSGLQRLTYASTSINSNSSRSHCIFFVDVLKYFSNGFCTATSYKFCDLAGSERVNKTGNVGSRLKEAQRINTSLMVLGRCLDAANNTVPSGSTTALIKTEHIPFRESKLTMLLQAALQGREKMTMIVNVTPTDKFYEENLNVLNFASIASNIIFKCPPVKRNQSRYSVFSTTGDSEYIQQLLDEIANLKADLTQQTQLINHLEEELERSKNEHNQELLKQEQELRNHLVDSFKATFDEHKQQFELRMQRELESQKRIYESRIEFINRKHQEELDDLREEYEDEADVAVKHEVDANQNDDA